MGFHEEELRSPCTSLERTVMGDPEKKWDPLRNSKVDSRERLLRRTYMGVEN